MGYYDSCVDRRARAERLRRGTGARSPGARAKRRVAAVEAQERDLAKSAYTFQQTYVLEGHT
jgi:hypothetical protein